MTINTYERNYWSLYFDFIDGFRILDYEGFSLPLLSHFYGLIKDNKIIISILKLETFSDFVINKVVIESDIQKKFDSYLTTKKKVFNENKGKGKVVLHDKLLRFPYQTLKIHFKPSKTLILKKRSTMKINTLGIPIYNLDNYLEDIKELTKFYLQKAIKTFHSYNNHPIFSNNEFQNRFLQELPTIINNVVAARNFLNNVPVSCLVLGSTNNSESRALALAALEKAIPSICMQHGIIALEFGYLPKVSTIQAVYGQYEVDWYKQKGVTETSIKIIGHPRFDEIFTRKSLTRNQFEKQLGLNPKWKSILFINHHEEIDIPRIIIKELLEKHHKVNIIIKPRGKSKDTKLLKQEFPAIYLPENLHLYDLLNNVDAVVSYQSTVALEAMLAKKPVFIWKKNVLSSTNYFASMDVFIETDPKILVSTILNYFNNEKMYDNAEQKRKEFISFCYPNSKEFSGERLMKLINSFI
ncbi:hypothetical protein [Metabacillus litoralis]|jgi:hypothetical protein|uniref:hypothetical protein n=1 Tax=Metabacillus litoralis TaxID=152268 RepID=UPI00203AA202|nr:hypothetical protein [Metabacillus litoralis]MCM3654521.1 hypothetical protein [Metabacillus litoralis]